MVSQEKMLEQYVLIQMLKFWVCHLYNQRARFRGRRKQTVGRDDGKEDTGDMIKQTKQTHSHKPKNILTRANHIRFRENICWIEMTLLDKQGTYVYLTSTAFC